MCDLVRPNQHVLGVALAIKASAFLINVERNFQKFNNI